MKGMKKLVLAAVATGLAAGSGVAAAARYDAWNWKVGGDVAYVGSPTGTSDVVVAAQGDIDFRAGHVRLISDNADFQFVHPVSTSVARVNAYYLGTPTRTPIMMGPPSTGDVTGLIVAGTAGQTSDLQQWTLGGKTVAAIDGSGRLRLGGVTLAPKVVNGRVFLYALTSTGQQLVAAGPKK